MTALKARIGYGFAGSPAFHYRVLRKQISKPFSVLGVPVIGVFSYHFSDGKSVCNGVIFLRVRSGGSKLQADNENHGKQIR